MSRRIFTTTNKIRLLLPALLGLLLLLAAIGPVGAWSSVPPQLRHPKRAVATKATPTTTTARAADPDLPVAAVASRRLRQFAESAVASSLLLLFAPVFFSDGANANAAVDDAAVAVAVVRSATTTADSIAIAVDDSCSPLPTAFRLNADLASIARSTWTNRDEALGALRTLRDATAPPGSVVVEPPSDWFATARQFAADGTVRINADGSDVRLSVVESRPGSISIKLENELLPRIPFLQLQGGSDDATPIVVTADTVTSVATPTATANFWDEPLPLPLLPVDVTLKQAALGTAGTVASAYGASYAYYQAENAREESDAAEKRKNSASESKKKQPRKKKAKAEVASAASTGGVDQSAAAPAAALAATATEEEPVPTAAAAAVSVDGPEPQQQQQQQPQQRQGRRLKRFLGLKRGDAAAA